MGIKKALLISIFTIGTIGVVSGAGVGIASAIQQQNNDGSSNEVIENNKKPTRPIPTETDNKNPSENNTNGVSDTELGDDPNSSLEKNETQTLTIESVAKNLSEKDVQIHPFKMGGSELDTQKVVEKDQTFAYSIKPIQITLKPKKEVQEKFDFKVELETNANTVKTLNNGELTIKIKVSEKQKARINQVAKTVESSPIKLTGFKKPSEEFKKLLGLDKDNYSITLTNESKTTTFSNIDSLNKKSMLTVPKKKGAPEEGDKKENVSGLTGLLWTNKFAGKDTYVGDVVIEGKVKVTSFEKNEKMDDTLFVLTSNEENNPLRLVKKDQNNKTDEILLENIKTTNLLASYVTVAPIDNDAKVNDELIDAVEKGSDETTRKHYTIENKQLSVTLDKSTSNNIFVKPYLITKPTDFETKHMVGVEIIITFGTKENASSFKTSDEAQRKLLVESGFSFDIYARHLSQKNNKLLDGSEITTALEKFKETFKKENYTKFSEKTAIDTVNAAQEMDTYGGFHAVNVASNSLETISFDASNTRDGSDLRDIATNLPANLLVFANYSYKSKGIMQDHASYTPVISLIHVQQQEGQ